MCYFPKFSLKETSVLHQPMRPCHHIRVQLSQQYNLKKKGSRSQPVFPSRNSSASSASFTPNLHHHHIDRRSRTISKKKEFSPCPLLPPLGFCRPLLAQTSTTLHTEAHRHRGRRSCAWSLETYRSRPEPRS